MFKRYYSKIPLEAIIWTTSLIVLAFYNPSTDTHFSLCPLYNLGFTFCPGCGLGKSIAFFFHGNIRASLSTHPLGIISVCILTARIVQQTQNYYKNLWHE